MAEGPNQSSARETDRERRPKPEAPTGTATSPGVARRIEVRPEDVLQPDHRPWRRLSLDGVVARLMLLSALALATLLAGAAGLGRLLGLW